MTAGHQSATSPDNTPRATLAHFLLRVLLSLEPLHENGGRPRYVSSAERFRLRAITGDDRIEDSSVLAQDGLRHLRVIT